MYSLQCVTNYYTCNMFAKDARAQSFESDGAEAYGYQWLVPYEVVSDVRSAVVNAVKRTYVGPRPPFVLRNFSYSIV
jgi:hypothetical protein